MYEKKVREAIYCMKSFVDEAVCEECDNYDRCDHTMVADNARTAIEALEKQLPKKPKEEKGAYTHKIGEFRIGKCPKCEAEVSDRFGRCLDCGQCLDWNWEKE